MKPAKFIRAGKQIKEVESGHTTGYKYYNEAKRESRRIQMEHDKALGRGTVRRWK
jgi:hypothetical protein